HYQDWIFPEQQRLDELFFQSVRRLTSELEARGEIDRALDYGLRAVSANRLREEAYREVVRLYIAAGQPDAALRHYRELERVLEQELDAAPAPATRALVEALPTAGAPTDPSPVIAASARLPAFSPPAAARMPEPEMPTPRSEQLEPVGGAVPLGSRFYVVRQTDEEIRAAIRRRDSIVLVKGPRQVGKTSLLARGLQQAREAGHTVALTHFQILAAQDLESSNAFLLALAETLSEQL